MDISRRDFLKRIGAGAAVAVSAAACTAKDNETTVSDIVVPIETKGTDMAIRTTPSTGDKVSLLGYGCMRWPTNENGDVDQEQVNRLVDYAMTHGVNFYDTSPAYCKGQSERATGTALRRYPRESYYISTKLSNFAQQTWSREESLDMYHRSFKELQVDYIDYLLLHGVGMGGIKNLEDRYIKNGVLDYLLAERKAGRIRNLGFSYHGDIEVFDYLLSKQDVYKWDFALIQLNYVDWHHAKATNPRNTNSEYLYEELHKRNIPALVMEPLLGGRLAKVHDHIAFKLKQREPQMSVASWAFRFAGTLPGILSVLSGMTYMEHLKDNLASYSPLKPLTDDEMAFLNDVAQELASFKTIPCNDCSYCMPCPYGIDIPSIIRHYNKCVNEGHIPVPLESDSPSDTERSEYARNRRIFLVGYDRSVPKLRQARNCIGCDKCMSHCPQRINIPREMQRIDRFVESLIEEDYR